MIKLLAELRASGRTSLILRPDEKELKVSTEPVDTKPTWRMTQAIV